MCALRRLAGSGLGLDIRLIDKRPTSDFLPLLPDIIGRGLSGRQLSCDISRVCSKLGAGFCAFEVGQVDLDKRIVAGGKESLSYDYLIIACGAQTNFYGNQNASDNAFRFDSVSDAERLSRAVSSGGYENFIVSGAGYTGIEAAGNIWLFARKNKRSANIVIVEKAASILGPLPGWVKEHVKGNLSKMNIRVMVNCAIEKIEGQKVRLCGGQEFDKAMVVWTAGVKTPDFIQRLSLEKNPQGRIAVDEYLGIGRDCFVAGDCAYFKSAGEYLRMAVQFARTQGDCAALNVIRSIKGLPLAGYRPFDFGYIIPMANNLSCGRVLGADLKGRLATLLHYLICIYRSCGIKNKIGVFRELAFKQGGRG